MTATKYSAVAKLLQAADVQEKDAFRTLDRLIKQLGDESLFDESLGSIKGNLVGAIVLRGNESKLEAFLAAFEKIAA